MKPCLKWPEIAQALHNNRVCGGSREENVLLLHPGGRGTLAPFPLGLQQRSCSSSLGFLSAKMTGAKAWMEQAEGGFGLWRQTLTWLLSMLAAKLEGVVTCHCCLTQS